jgi:DNA-binding PadR family transcriptional regulator
VDIGDWRRVRRPAECANLTLHERVVGRFCLFRLQILLYTGSRIPKPERVMGRGEHLGELEALILAAVMRVGEEANGTAVYEEVENRSGRTGSLPAVHVTLRRLEEKGLLTSEVGEPSRRGGRPRRYYRPTSDGVRALRDFREMWRKVWRGLELPDPEALS